MSVSANIGMQLCMMTLVSLVFICLGFLFPYCEALLATMLALYVILGMMPGYIFAYLYKTTGVL